MTHQVYASQFIDKLSQVYDRREAQNIFFLILEHLKKWTRIKFELNKELEVKDEEYSLFDEYLSELLKGKPVQQLIGSTYFYGLKFLVDKHTLIPRPETEELVDLIINRAALKEEINILDIGTGSGCIIISLAKNLSGEFTALDVSSNALNVAKENARSNDADVYFIEADILNLKMDFPKYDVIVSNPPYIPESDKSVMNDNVVNFEPHLALFVEDNDPLIFYRHILEFATSHLSDEGRIYFEIHEDYKSELEVILKYYTYKSLFHKDLQGKYRILELVN